jgi:hypothetical protein
MVFTRAGLDPGSIMGVFGGGMGRPSAAAMEWMTRPDQRVALLQWLPSARALTSAFGMASPM